MRVSGRHDCKITKLIDSNPDLHKTNIVFETKDLDGVRQWNVLDDLVTPRCVPVLTQNPQDQADTLPKYLVRSAELLEVVEEDDLRIKIIDFGEGSSSSTPSLL